MTYEFDFAGYDEAVDQVPTGSAISLTGELDLSASRTPPGGHGFEFVLCLAFGQDAYDVVKPPPGFVIPLSRDEAPAARNALAYGLSDDFDSVKGKYIDEWQKTINVLRAPDPLAVSYREDIYRMSQAVLLMHEDQAYDGAFVASSSIPWGECTWSPGHYGGGYHLVWPRDMSQTVGALLCSGDYEAALRGLRWLSVSQQCSGLLFQHFLVDGTPTGEQLQLDEVAFPIMHAFRLAQQDKLKNFDPLPFIIGCAATIIWRGPKTEGERWEEKAGYSPSTLASNIAALVCAAVLVRKLAGNESLAVFFEEYADFLERHLEQWTTTRNGTPNGKLLLSGVRHYYVRISDQEEPDNAYVGDSNGQSGCPAKDMVDAGFLQLVRYGIRAANDPLIVDSVKVVDEVISHSFASAGGEPRICFYRYNHDGYGQKTDGQGWKNYPDDAQHPGNGVGGPWPLLAGERAHYEIARGGDPGVYLRSFEYFANDVGLFPEQVWTLPETCVELPDGSPLHLVPSRSTGSAVPLVWAHAEYVKLVQSISDGKVVDFIPEVASRYISRSPQPTTRIEYWSFGRKSDNVRVRRGQIVRIPSDRQFVLHWSNDTWRTTSDLHSSPSVVGTSDRTYLHTVDLDTTPLAGSRIDFTFFWSRDNKWESDNNPTCCNFSISIDP